RDFHVTGVQTCALPIYSHAHGDDPAPAGQPAAEPAAPLPGGLPRPVRSNRAQRTGDHDDRVAPDLQPRPPTADANGGIAPTMPRSEERRVGKARRTRRG